MLDKQCNIYSVDTGHFYSNHEKYLHDMNCKYRRERNYLNNKLADLEKRLNEYGYTKKDIKLLKSNKSEEVETEILPEHMETIKEYVKWNKLIIHKRKKANESKEKLLSLLSNKIYQNEITNGKDHIREIRDNCLTDNNVISVFDSALTRTIGIKQDELTDALMVIQVYYFDVFKDLSYYGFTYKGEKYKYFTSSAGQIRKKKAVFIKDSIWNRIEKTVMCGLTIDKINSKGGNNVNKHLAYMALTNSATDLWEEFDIDKSIVIDDFETNVYGTFDFIDESDYSITRKTDYVPIPHTDGAGMMLPSVSKKNFMFRAPWVKGLLGVFDFRRFVEINHCPSTIKDIYGKEHDIIKEDIQVIFTKSQFKMQKYYDSWDEYKTFYKKYNCTAGICNVEEDRVKNAKINYQMLQTLTNISDSEIDTLVQKSAKKIESVCTSKDTMLNILGVTPYNTKMTPFQKAIKIYPSLLSDTYAKDVIREVKDSLLKKYRSGKLEVVGKYTFLLPDFYAACEYWFEGIEQPNGLLSNKEVFCNLFKKSDKLDCLRSPHLYKEHAIRFNVASDGYGDRVLKTEEWFTTNAIYTSVHDLISKILQFDVDGDKSLVVADSSFIAIAERNMNGVVPLYYNMRKAEPMQLNSKNIYSGLNAAFTGGNIGIYSNNISKIWNDDVFIHGTETEKQHAVDCVKRLCCQNNFVIDYAKTLYKPEFPKHINEEIQEFTKKKLPGFFKYAKDKEKEQVELRNQSFVNKIFDRIPNKTINTKGLNLGSIDYHLLMGNVNTICSEEVANLHDELNRKYRYMINMKDEYVDNLRYVACKIRDRFCKTGYSEDTITDMLVEYLYGHEKRYKQLLWFCYGQNIVNNLEKNIQIKKTKFIQCIDCGEYIEIDIKDTNTERCENCYIKHRKRKIADNVKRYRNKKM
uniref:RNA dependent RNA polymerase n=1 Tax=Clostridium sp. 12(A) TaxID=1163671 RepID=UPI0004B86D71|nr:hypothetical protein [Clostridium sp. 12(A)]